MQSIAVLKLPNLPQMSILDELGVEELFILSILSKRAKQLASSAKRTIDILKWELDQSRQYIHVSTDLMFIVPMMALPEDPSRITDFAEWKLNDELFPIYRMGAWYIGDRFSAGLKNEKKLLEWASKHLLEVFPCQEFELWTTEGVPEDLFIFQYTRRFKTLTFFGASVPIPAKDLKFVLEKLEVRETLHVARNVPGFQWSGPLRMDKLDARDPDWLTFKALMSNECKELKLRQHTFTSAQLNTFLRRWVTGRFPKLEYCSLIPRETLSKPIVLQGIETMRYNPANRPEIHPREDWYLTINKDVDIRRNDGVYGTIDVSDNRFILAVWINL